MRTTEVSSARRSTEVVRDADSCLRPPIDGFGVVEFSRIDEIVEAGLRHAQRTLGQRQRDPSRAIVPPSEERPRAGDTSRTSTS